MPRGTRMTLDELAAAAVEDELAHVPASQSKNPSWQSTFRQLKDFHEMGKAKSPPPRLVKWMDAQRRRYKLYAVGRKQSVGIMKYRINQLNSIGFDWHHGEEKTPDRDPHPRVILPPQSSLASQRIAGTPLGEQYLQPPTRRHQNKNAQMSRSPAGGKTEIPKHSMDRKQLLSAGFPEQLFRMVNDTSERATRHFKWLPAGDAFEILDTKNVGGFIRQYFRHSNFSSLRRMLHLYGFSTANNVYRHPHFHRDSTLADIKRNVVLSQKNESIAEKIAPIHHETISPPHVDSKPQSIISFPELLFNMVNDASRSHPHVITWLPQGDAFEIDPKNAGRIIQNYFRHGKVSSLRRMLHLYQFHTANNVFRHAYFHRDRSLAYIKRLVVKK